MKKELRETLENRGSFVGVKYYSDYDVKFLDNFYLSTDITIDKGHSDGWQLVYQNMGVDYGYIISDLWDSYEYDEEFEGSFDDYIKYESDNTILDYMWNIYDNCIIELGIVRLEGIYKDFEERRRQQIIWNDYKFTVEDFEEGILFNFSDGWIRLNFTDKKGVICEFVATDVDGNVLLTKDFKDLMDLDDYLEILFEL